MNLDTRIFYGINHFARDTPWLQPIVSGYAAYGVVLFAVLLLAAWWTARNDADPARMVAAMWGPLGMLAAGDTVETWRQSARLWSVYGDRRRTGMGTAIVFVAHRGPAAADG